jgi:hypothetical protein
LASPLYLIPDFANDLRVSVCLFPTVLPSPAMEGLGAVLSVIAVVSLCVKVASLCVQYSLAVIDAKNDITRLQVEVKSLRDVLGEVKPKQAASVL